MMATSTTRKLPLVTGKVALALAVVAALAACGSDKKENNGQLNGEPTTVASVSAAVIDGAATQTGLIGLTGAAKCSVDVSSINYDTLGGAGENTNATAAVMVPKGTAAECTGARPIVLYAHGTTTDKRKNMANVTTDGEAGLVMTFYAAQGFIVVAPNYAGYDASALSYHPYLNAEQQSKDMLDALRAAKTVLTKLGGSASSKLFITGYSQGGHVALATHKAIEQKYSSEFSLTASAPLSGPYSLKNFAALIFADATKQNIGATIFTPLLIDSFQRSYGNIYAAGNPGEVYNAPYTFAAGLFPSTDPNTATARLPAGADLTYRTLFNRGDGQPYLINDSFRTSAQVPTSGYSKALALNDLITNWKPTKPVALCYGAQDPTVFGFNSTDAQTAFSGSPVARWDLEDGATLPAGAAALKAAFDAQKANIANAAGGGAAGQGAVLGQYHGGIVPAYCNALALSFFKSQ